MSFNTSLWQNFRNEIKRRGENIQDVFDEFMAHYLNVKLETTSVEYEDLKSDLTKFGKRVEDRRARLQSLGCYERLTKTTLEEMHYDTDNFSNLDSVVVQLLDKATQSKDSKELLYVQEFISFMEDLRSRKIIERKLLAYRRGLAKNVIVAGPEPNTNENTKKVEEVTVTTEEQVWAKESARPSDSEEEDEIPEDDEEEESFAVEPNRVQSGKLLLEVDQRGESEE